MRHLDLFSGILGFSECARRAWPDDYHLLAACEIDRWCHMVERRHRRSVQIIQDVEQCDGRDFEAVDLVTFGWPCQDLSVAGKRAGLAGSRSGLLYEAVRILTETKARWFVAENVPGLLSANERRDMGTAVRLMEELGYCVSWTVLDAQFAGVAQRRERVFFVGSLGNTGSIQVLFEPESVCWNPPPSREAGQGTTADVAPSIGASGRGFSRAGESRGQDPVVACTQYGDDVAGTLTRRHDSSPCSDRGMNVVGVSTSGKGYWREEIGALRARGQDSHENLVVGALSCNAGPKSHDAGNFHCNQAVDAGYIIPVAYDTTQITSKDNRCNPKPGDPCHPLSSQAHAPLVAFSCKDYGNDAQEDLSPTLRSMNHDKSHINGGGQVAIAFSGGQSCKSRSLGLQKEQAPTLRGASSGTNQVPCVAFTLHGADKTVSTATETDCAGSVRTKPPGSIENSSTTVAVQDMRVRRLTPVEAHRLQGYPDDWCAWGIDESGNIVVISDTQQYRMLGNAVALPPVEWIMKRIKAIESGGRFV